MSDSYEREYDRERARERARDEGRREAAWDAFYDEWRWGKGSLDKCHEEWERVYYGG